jgi:hypothetical protein
VQEWPEDLKWVIRVLSYGDVHCSVVSQSKLDQVF